MGRSDRQGFWGGGTGAEGAVGPHQVVFPPPALAEDLGLAQRVAVVAGEALVGAVSV